MEHEACSGKWRQHSPAFDSFSLLPIFVDAIVDFLFSESRQGIKVNWDFLVYESVCTTPFKMATPEIEIHHRFFRNSIYSSFPNSSRSRKTRFKLGSGKNKYLTVKSLFSPFLVSR
ncbi:uncharacterized protein [Gossypium hirsutum]|uniref:Uncharacterized protein isoform X2 n=1 Tax=Gossypium hirsutum TaxID=3635 RepID=A0ABM2ZDN4_GOSHI|nr:uncharacterized protein LOC121212380 isoform X2 [Gossypium hirsutum]